MPLRRTNTTVYTGKVGAKMRAPKHKVGSAKIIKKPYQCEDGPMKGSKLWLTDGETLVMKIKNEIGKYVCGKWVPV